MRIFYFSLAYEHVVFLDETWINSNISKDVGWTDGSVNYTLGAPLGKGQRLIICHAGGAVSYTHLDVYKRQILYYITQWSSETNEIKNI